MSPGAELGASDRAPGLLLGEGVELPEDVEIGGHVVVHAGTRIGAGARLQDGCVIGKPVALGSRSSSAGGEAPGPASIGAGTTVGAGAVVLEGATIGGRCVIADQAHVRERTAIGDECVVGRGASVENDVRIGARVRMQTGAYVTAWSVVEDDVFIAPGRDLHERPDRGPAPRRRGAPWPDAATRVPHRRRRCAPAGRRDRRGRVRRGGGRRDARRAGGSARDGRAGAGRPVRRRHRSLAPGRGTLLLGALATATVATADRRRGQEGAPERL